MHDHSRFQRDIDDVTGDSLSLLLTLTKVTHAQYRKRFGASYNMYAHLCVHRLMYAHLCIHVRRAFLLAKSAQLL